jgi:hypothetical protein
VRERGRTCSPRGAGPREREPYPRRGVVRGVRPERGFVLTGKHALSKEYLVGQPRRGNRAAGGARISALIDGSRQDSYAFEGERRCSVSQELP